MSGPEAPVRNLGYFPGRARALMPQSLTADLEGPQIYHLLLYLLAVGHKNTKYPRMKLRIPTQPDTTARAMDASKSYKFKGHGRRQTL
jgi:hypothetical protein